MALHVGNLASYITDNGDHLAVRIQKIDGPTATVCVPFDQRNWIAGSVLTAPFAELFIDQPPAPTDRDGWFYPHPDALVAFRI